MKRTAALIFTIFFFCLNFTHSSEVDPAVTEYYSHILGLNTTDYSAFEKHLNQIIDKPTVELRNVLRNHLTTITEEDPESIKQHPSDFLNLILLILDTLEKKDIGEPNDARHLAGLNNWAEQVFMDSDLKKIQDKSYYLHMGLVNRSKTPLPTITERFQDESRQLIVYDADTNPAAKQRRSFEIKISRVEHFYDRVKKEVIGQDRILQDLQNQFLIDSIIDGQRDKPEVFYLMGLPGTGKDTITESYVDALWAEKGAHKEHMFSMNIRSKNDVWSYFGSGKGYIGSEELPAFLKFLVMHSGGRYQLKEIKDRFGSKKQIVVKGNNWNQSMTGAMPHKAVVFINEAHNIPKEIKDNVLKQAIEKGLFFITNPGDDPDAVDKLEIPITFIFASNEGIGLLEPREKNGTRIGEPLSYDEIIENYNRVSEDKQLLKQTILDYNGEKNDPSTPEAPGTSEEFLSRVPSNRIHLMKPLSPHDLIRITRLIEQSLMDRFRKTKGEMGKFDIKLHPSLIEFITTYKIIASEGARTLKDRMESYILKPFTEAVIAGQIPENSGTLSLNISLVKNKNGSKSLSFEIHEGKRKKKFDRPAHIRFFKVIEDTKKDIPKPPLENETIEEILTLKNSITSNVFGVEHIIDRLTESLLSSESESRNTDSKRPATVMAFLGKTSTGKTETAKQYVKARYGEDSRPEVIDFNGVRDLYAMQSKILGTTDSRNNPIASTFMKAYDRANGKITFIFDEAANAPKEILKGLYEILRESVATGFSDGKARPMKNVTIILTGNAGEEIYQAIPEGLSTTSYGQAMTAVFNIFSKDEALQHKILQNTFPEALIARLGRNIYHFGPLGHADKRRIAQLKLLQGIENLKPTDSERGWNLIFSSKKDLLESFYMIEEEAYSNDYQGASIDKFVREGLIDSIKAKLLSAGVKNNTDVYYSIGELNKNKASNDPPYRTITLKAETGEHIDFDAQVLRAIEESPKKEIKKVLVAYHEVGHELVSHYYLNEIVDSSKITIIPGVTTIDGQIIAYSGVRVGDQTFEAITSKEFVLRRLAVLVGGYVAEELVTIGSHSSSGKSNDITRASAIIHEAVLKWGLSKRWGKKALPSKMDLDDYVEKYLSEDEKIKLEVITRDWLSTAEEMAEIAIVSNLDGAFLNLTNNLAKSGELLKDEIKAIYDDTELVLDSNHPVSNGFNPKKTYLRMKKQLVTEINTEFLSNTDYIYDISSDHSLYEKAYTDLQKNSEAKDFKAWTELTDHEKRVAEILISGMVEPSSLFPKLSSTFWNLDEVADVEEIQNQRVLDAKEGVIDFKKFKIKGQTNKPKGLRSTLTLQKQSSSLTCNGLLR